MKWACDAADTSGLVTDPELIEKLNAKRDAQNTELTQEEPESRQQVTAGKSQEEPDEEAPEKDISRTSETKELAEVDEEKESAEPELPEPEAPVSLLASISEFSIWGLRLGLTMEQILAELNNRYRKVSKPSYRWFPDCEQRGNVKVCFGLGRDGLRNKIERSATIMFYEGVLIFVQYEGDVMHQARFARVAETLGSEHPPTKVSEKQMSW